MIDQLDREHDDGREPPRTQVRPKTVMTVAATLLLFVALVWFVVSTTLSMMLLLASGLLAMALDRAVGFFQGRGMPRGLAIALVFVILLGAFVGAGFLVIPPTIEQGQRLAERWPQIVDNVQQSSVWQRLQDPLDLEQRLESLRDRADSLVAGAASQLLSMLGNVVAGLTAFLSLLVVTLFMLVWGPGLVRAGLRETLPWRRSAYRRILGKIYHSVGGYLGGLLFLGLVNAAVTSIYLAILGVPFFLPLGLLSGLGSLVPFVGATVTGALMSIIAASAQGIWVGVATAAYVIVYQQVENNLLSPLVYRRTVNLNPLVTLLAVIFFAELYGVIGALLAVPLVAIGQILLREWLILRRELYRLPVTPEASPAVAAAREEEERAGDGPPQH